MPWIRTDGDEHRVPLMSQRLQYSSLPGAELAQVSRRLEVKKASIELQDPDRGNDKIFRPLRYK